MSISTSVRYGIPVKVLHGQEAENFKFNNAKYLPLAEYTLSDLPKGAILDQEPDL